VVAFTIDDFYSFAITYPAEAVQCERVWSCKKFVNTIS